MSKVYTLTPTQGSTITFTNIYTPETEAEANIALDDLQAFPTDVVLNTGLATLSHAHINEYMNNGKVTLVDPNAWKAMHVAAIRLYGTNSYVYLQPGDSVTITARSSAEALYYWDQKCDFLDVSADFVTEEEGPETEDPDYGLYLDRTTGLGDKESINFNSEEVTNELLGKITVTFDNGGTDYTDDPNPEPQKIDKGSIPTRPFDPTPKSGYIFETWKIGSSAYTFDTPLEEDTLIVAGYMR